MKMYACAWRDQEYYAVQVNDVKHGDKKIITNLFKGWNQKSFGWNVKSGEQLFIFTKQFSDEKEWLSWAKTCPFKLVEKKYRAGKEKEIQLTCKTRKKRDK